MIFTRRWQNASAMINLHRQMFITGKIKNKEIKKAMNLHNVMTCPKLQTSLMQCNVCIMFKNMLRFKIKRAVKLTPFQFDLI